MGLLHAGIHRHRLHGGPPHGHLRTHRSARLLTLRTATTGAATTARATTGGLILAALRALRRIRPATLDGGGLLRRASGGLLRRASGGLLRRASGGLLRLTSGGLLRLTSGGLLRLTSGGLLRLTSGGLFLRRRALSRSLRTGLLLRAGCLTGAAAAHLAAGVNGQVVEDRPSRRGPRGLLGLGAR
jgi:hypothetical protein